MDNFRFHYAMTTMVLVLIATWFVTARPFDVSNLEIGVFVLVTQFSSRIHILQNKRFMGYGVARRLNTIVGSSLFESFGGLALYGFAIKPMVRSWMWSIFACAVLSAVAVWRYSYPETLYDLYIARYIAVYVVAHTIARLAEFYVWVMAQRQVCWRCPEQMLRDVLRKHGYKPRRIDELVTRAKRLDLLAK